MLRRSLLKASGRAFGYSTVIGKIAPLKSRIVEWSRG